jgi:hypothetical protein
MRRSNRLRLSFFVAGFCFCLFLIVVVRYLSGLDTNFFSNSESEVVFHKIGECEDCRKISMKHWNIGSLKDNNDIHLENAKRFGIKPFETNSQFENEISSFCRWGKLKELKDCKYYRLKNLTHSYPYLVPQAADLLDEIGERFQKKLEEMDIDPYYMMISSVLRTYESQDGLGKRNGNATKSVSAHFYGTTFDISYKEFLPTHGKPAPEGFCRHDMLRHPLAEVLTEMIEEGKCVVVREVRQACYHVTITGD